MYIVLLIKQNREIHCFQSLQNKDMHNEKKHKSQMFNNLDILRLIKHQVMIKYRNENANE